ncbi:MAG: hypothetical protein ACE5IY_01925 [bacterium]
MCCFYEAKTLKLNNKDIPTEPTEQPDLIRIRTKFAGQRCPVCLGYGRLKCLDCEGGRVAFLGGFQQCGRCLGAGIRACAVCEAHGFIRPA